MPGPVTGAVEVSGGVGVEPAPGRSEAAGAVTGFGCGVSMPGPVGGTVAANGLVFGCGVSMPGPVGGTVAANGLVFG